MQTQDKVTFALKKRYKEVHKSTCPSREVIEECLSTVDSRVTTDMNKLLQQEFTRLDVEEALHQMAPLKSPCPDGFGTCFYQSYWHVIGD